MKVDLSVESDECNLVCPVCNECVEVYSSPVLLVVAVAWLFVFGLFLRNLVSEPLCLFIVIDSCTCGFRDRVVICSFPNLQSCRTLMSNFYLAHMPFTSSAALACRKVDQKKS